MIIAQENEARTATSATALSNNVHTSPHRALRTWLMLCCALVFIMIVIGAITRLTESGLSIVEWKLVTGIIPPITEAQWQLEFEEYRNSPEFLKKNFWMTVSDFKNIYFWEWLHRLLGRIIGLAYALPFLFFLYKRAIPKGYVLKMGGLVVLVGAQGLMGWYMVQSGLVDQPAVSHFRLAAHLGLALILYAMTLWYALALGQVKNNDENQTNQKLRTLGWGGLLLLSITILWGAFTAGLDAGLVYNDTFPMMGKNWIPDEITQAPAPLTTLIENHAGVQFLHRWLAMLTAAYLLAYALYAIFSQNMQGKSWPALVIMILAQVALGIITLFSAVHIVPAALHQAGAVALLTLMIIILHATGRPPAPAERG